MNSASLNVKHGSKKLTERPRPMPPVELTEEERRQQITTNLFVNLIGKKDFKKAAQIAASGKMDKVAAQTFLRIYCDQGEDELVAALLENDVDVNEVADDGRTILVSVIINEEMPQPKKSNIVKSLIAKGADINKRIDAMQELSALHFAAKSCDQETFKFLIEKSIEQGGDLDQCGNEGMTPALFALASGNEENYQILLNNGATGYELDEDLATYMTDNRLKLPQIVKMQLEDSESLGEKVDSYLKQKEAARLAELDLLAAEDAEKESRVAKKRAAEKKRELQRQKEIERQEKLKQQRQERAIQAMADEIMEEVIQEESYERSNAERKILAEIEDFAQSYSRNIVQDAINEVVSSVRLEEEIKSVNSSPRASLFPTPSPFADDNSGLDSGRSSGASSDGYNLTSPSYQALYEENERLKALAAEQDSLLYQKDVAIAQLRAEIAAIRDVVSKLAHEESMPRSELSPQPDVKTLIEPSYKERPY